VCRAVNIAILLLALAAGAFFSAARSAGEEKGDTDRGLGRWEELPLPDGKHPHVSQMVMEPGGTVWILASGGLHYWDGNRFREPLSGRLIADGHIARLYGGEDRGAYVAQVATRENRGRLYRLSDGRAHYLTEFYYDLSFSEPGVYISKSGTVYNWGIRFLAVFSQGEWHRVEAKLGPATLIFDTCDSVYFYYNEKLYSVNRGGNITAHDIPGSIKYLPARTVTIPGTRRILGALWGDHKMVIFQSGGDAIYGFDLQTCQPVPTGNLDLVPDESKPYDIFAARDGSVWILVRDWKTHEDFFYRMTPAGEVTRIEQSRHIHWEIERCRKLPHSVLNASDGSIWFALPEGEIARYKGGKLRIFGWKDGMIAGSVRYLFEDPRGEIYAAGRAAIYVFHPGEAAAPIPAKFALWDEYGLASYAPIRDSFGQIWVLMRDRPGLFSCWDGSRWHHMMVPFDTSRVNQAITDDRGHILVCVSRDGWYDITRGCVVAKYEDLETALEARVAGGAKRFFTDAALEGCYVLPGGRIWYGYQDQDRFHYYDGERWDTFVMPLREWSMYESAKFGILFSTRAGKYYTYDRGQIVEVEALSGETNRLILGPNGFQPFEEKLLELHPELYIPVERDRDGNNYLLRRRAADNVADAEANNYERGASLPRFVQRVVPAFCGGYWAYGGVGWTGYRIFGGKVLKTDTTGTPLVGKGEQSVLDDGSHNLWIHAGGRRLFRKRLDRFALKATEVPEEVKRSVEIEVEPVLPGLDPQSLRLFWRFKGGPWRDGNVGKSLTIRFPRSGEYRIEVLGMEPLGGITRETWKFVVNATVPLPDTELTVEGPYTLRDVVWVAPAKPIASEPGATPRLTYRIDGGVWKMAPAGRIPIGESEPGAHQVEIAAEEQGYYRDPTPLRLSIFYEPDFHFIVASRLDMLAGDDRPKADHALSEIKMAGRQIIPVLREELTKARKAARLSGVLEQVLRELESERNF